MIFLALKIQKETSKVVRSNFQDEAKQEVVEEKEEKLEEPVKNPPKVTKKLSDTSAKLGGSAVLSVECDSIEDLMFEWYKNGRRVDSSEDRYTIKIDKGRCILELSNCEVQDDGMWKVVARNDVGQCESDCKLSVEVPRGHKTPVFEVGLMN